MLNQKFAEILNISNFYASSAKNLEEIIFLKGI